MKLKNFRKILILPFLLIFSSSLYCEEKIDIWKNSKQKKQNEKIDINPKSLKEPEQINLKPRKEKDTNQTIKIDDNLNDTKEQTQVFGIYDPSKNNFDINMWTLTKAEDVRSSLKRINKMNLSKHFNPKET